MNNLVPIKIRIKRGNRNGRVRNIYPDFNSIDSVIRKDMDWSYFVDANGIGLHYDKLDGFGEGTNPQEQFCATCVPKNFADEAVALFPNDVEIITETAFEIFYNDRAHIQEPDEILDAEILQGIVAKRNLGLPAKPSEDDALDPDKPCLGIRKNHNKTWARKKLKQGIAIHAAYKKK